MQQLVDRPPYVVFETRAVEDRAESIEKGYYVAKNIDIAIVTPQGSKDRLEKEVAPWFESLLENVRSERFPQEWYSMFQARYKAYKEGQELPEHGTSVKNWPALSPAQVATCISARLLTIEDVAAANEESIMRLGMGGRSLKERALAWLESAKDTGAMSERLAAMQVENDSLKGTLASMQKQLDELAKLVPQAKKL